MGRDRTAPTISFVNLTAGQVLKGTYKITANASDNRGIANVAFYVDDMTTPKHTELYTPYDFELDTTKYPDGVHTIKAKANDGSSNSKSVSVSVSFKNEPIIIITPTGAFHDEFQGPVYCLTADGAKSPDGKWISGYVAYGSACIKPDTADQTNQVFVTTPKLDSALRACRIDSILAVNNMHCKLTARLDHQNTYNTQSWYTVWPLFGYVDETNHYYFNLKTNGWELGKKDNDLDPSLELQRYLASGSSPIIVIGQKNDIECWIVLGKSPANGVECNHIVVKVNGAKIVDLWDDGTHSDGMGKINPTGAKLKGPKRISLYNEACQVSWDKIVLEEATGVPA